MSIIKVASFGYEIFVVLSSTQSIYNVRSFRQIRVNNVLFGVPVRGTAEIQFVCELQYLNFQFRSVCFISNGSL